jgi:hypothetical protein
MQKLRRGTSPRTTSRSNSVGAPAGHDLTGPSGSFLHGSRRAGALRGGSGGHERPPGALQPFASTQRQQELEEMVDVRCILKLHCTAKFNIRAGL